MAHAAIKLGDVARRGARICWPQRVACFCTSTSRRDALWTLCICGPFCLWPKMSINSNARVDNLANSLSRLLRLSVRPNIYGNRIKLEVIVPQEKLDEIRKAEYRAALRMLLPAKKAGTGK